jgi:Arc/MetJ family transcription regulator
VVKIPASSERASVLGANNLGLDDTQKVCHHYTSRFGMRTNIDIDDELMRQAMRSSGAPTKRAAVEAGLRLLVKTHAQSAIRAWRGKVRWTGDLEESRRGRNQE